MNQIIRNKVEESGLITIDLKEFLPQNQPVLFDLTPFLFKGLILKEKEFRKQIAEHDWVPYQNKTVLVFCSADAIIPVWAYMLVVVSLGEHTSNVSLLHPDRWKEEQLINNIKNLNTIPYKNARVVIKGCGDEKIPDAAFLEITKKLFPVAKSILYGEPCSTVPVYKKK